MARYRSRIQMEQPLCSALIKKYSKQLLPKAKRSGQLLHVEILNMLANGFSSRLLWQWNIYTKRWE